MLFPSTTLLSIVMQILMHYVKIRTTGFFILIQMYQYSETNAGRSGN